MAELGRRLKIFINLPLASLDRLSIQSHVDEIGQSRAKINPGEGQRLWRS
jgi:arsenate reductase (thioredoxin)